MLTMLCCVLRPLLDVTNMSSAQPESPSWPWSPGSATGIGSLPGTDIVEATRVVLGELPDMPHIPELPQRGPGAEIIGRGAALLVDLPAEIYAGRWRVAPHPGADLRVARDYLRWDCDALTDAASEWDGHFKLQATGPWTLASALTLPIGGPLLRDPGAARDLAFSLADGVRSHVAEVQARMPRATIVLQLDEPALPSVLAGRVATESGLGTLRPVEESVARAALARVIERSGVPVIVHCCASAAPLELIREAGAAAVAVDLSLMDNLDALGSVLDAGLGLVAGAVDPRTLTGSTTRLDPRAAVDETASRVRRLWHVLGFPPSTLSSQVMVSPACGLAGLSENTARQVLSVCRESAHRLVEDAG